MLLLLLLSWREGHVGEELVLMVEMIRGGGSGGGEGEGRRDNGCMLLLGRDHLETGRSDDRCGRRR